MRNEQEDEIYFHEQKYGELNKTHKLIVNQLNVEKEKLHKIKQDHEYRLKTEDDKYQAL